MAAADDEAERLIGAGWPHRDLALLTTNHRHPMQIELVSSRGRDGYWDAFWDDEQFFYCTVPGFKGLERPAVVVAVDGFRDESTARETLLVGLSRGPAHWVVCGVPGKLRPGGGHPHPPVPPCGLAQHRGGASLRRRPPRQPHGRLDVRRPRPAGAGGAGEVGVRRADLDQAPLGDC